VHARQSTQPSHIIFKLVFLFFTSLSCFFFFCLPLSDQPIYGGGHNSLWKQAGSAVVTFRVSDPIHSLEKQVGDPGGGGLMIASRWEWLTYLCPVRKFRLRTLTWAPVDQAAEAWLSGVTGHFVHWKIPKGSSLHCKQGRASGSLPSSCQPRICLLSKSKPIPSKFPPRKK
jgi:hypothetical protein